MSRNTRGEHETTTEGAASGSLRLRPLELLVFAVILALFTGLVVLYSTREIALAGIFSGAAFLAGLIFLTVFSFAAKPNPTARDDDADEEHGER